MKRMITLAIALFGLLLSTAAFAQNIGPTFDEAGMQAVIDGRTDLVPNPDLFNFDSAVVWVVAYDIPEIFGYEYNLTSTDFSSIVSTPTIWPAEGSDFATLTGDVRVGTGICFQAGSTQAGPDPTHIRLAKHQYTWFAPPTVDVFYCIHPSQASVNLSGVVAPQYTECVSNPVSLPFALAPGSQEDCRPAGCALIVFEWEPDGVTRSNCWRVPAQSQNWGALKAAY